MVWCSQIKSSEEKMDFALKHSSPLQSSLEGCGGGGGGDSSALTDPNTE